jgi:NAD dependent epimerase/dehydratase family enzyme
MTPTHQHHNHPTLKFKSRPRLIIVGYGDIGQRLVKLLNTHQSNLSNNIRLSTLGRQRLTTQPNLSGKPHHFTVDLDQPNKLLRRISNFIQHAIYLVPPDTKSLLTNDQRSQLFLQAIARARGLKNKTKHKGTPSHLKIISQSNSIHPKPLSGKIKKSTSVKQRFIYMSTTGVYGDCQGKKIKESHPINPENLRAKRRVYAENLWRDIAIHIVQPHTAKVSILRVPGIYAKERLPIERLQKKIPALISEDDVYTSHIHADDLAKITWLTLWRGYPQRIYHASDDTTLKMADYFDLIANHFSLPNPPRLPRAILKTQVNALQYSFMQSSRRLDNLRLKKELSVKLSYPTIYDFLENNQHATQHS